MILLALRGLAARRLRSLLTGLAILLGVAMIAGTYVETDQVRHAFTGIERTAYAGNDVVVTARQAFRSDVSWTPDAFSFSLVQRVVRVPGVLRAEGSLIESGSLVVHGRRVGSRFAPGLVQSDQQAPFDPLRYVQGGKPQPGEVSVNRKLATDERLRVGRRVTIATRSGVEHARLSGIFDYGTVGSLGGATMIVAPLDDVQRWYGEVGRISRIAVAAAPGVSAVALARAVRLHLGGGVTVRTGAQEAAKQSGDINDAMGRFMTPMLLALAGAALLVGGFIIFNTFSITVAQRAREFALLRAIGATRGQLVAAVTGEALVLGGTASVLGLGAGLGFATALGALFDAAGMGIPRSGLVLEPRTIAVSLAVGVLVTVLAALSPALRATRVTPVQALTGQPAPATRRGRRRAAVLAGLVCAGGLGALAAGLFAGGPASARMGGMAGGAVLLFIGVALSARWFVRPLASVVGRPVERLFHEPGRLARENAMRNPSRTAATSAALMVGLGLVVFVSVFAAGLKASVNRSMDELVKADYVVSAASVEPLPAGAGRAIAATPGVAAAAQLRVDQVAVDGRPKNLATDSVEGIDPVPLAAVYRFKWIHGNDADLRNLGATSALIEQQFAKAHHLRVGETFTVRTPSGRTTRLTAVAEYDDPQLLQGMMVTSAAFKRLSTARDPYYFFIRRRLGADPAAVHRALDAAMRRFPTAQVQSNAEYRADIEGQLDQIVNLLYALLAMSVLISLFGIANSLVLSIHERTREFGLLRAIGATSSQVKRVVRYESVITATIGGLLGTLVGVALAWLMTRALEDLGFGFSVPIGQLAIFLAVAVLAGLLGAILPARRSARIDVLEALRHE